MYIDDAPADLSALFHAWLAEDRPLGLKRPLIEALRPYRGTCLVAGQWVFWLCKRSDIDDDGIEYHRRSMCLGKNHTFTHRREAVIR